MQFGQFSIRVAADFTPQGYLFEFRCFPLHGYPPDQILLRKFRRAFRLRQRERNHIVALLGAQFAVPASGDNQILLTF